MEERFDYDGLLEVNSDLRKQLADAQATVEALQKKYDDLLGKYRQLVDFYDKHNGTPCGQIRHQQQVEALQARVRELEESSDAWRASQECSEKAYMALVNQIPAERFDYDPVNVALLDGAKEQEIIGRKQIADLQAALDAEREKVKALDAMYRQQLEGRDKRIDNLAGSAKIWMEKLTQIRALVRVYKEAVDYYAKTAISARAVDALEKAATLDSTTPAPDTSIIGKCEPPSQWDPNAQVRGDIS